MLNFHVRAAKPVDASSISTLILAGSEEAVGSEGTPEEVDNWRSNVANINIINKRINEPSIRMAVAENSSHHTQLGIIGTGYATVNENGEGFIGGITSAVKEKGIEAQIIKDLANWLKSSRAHVISISISHTNENLKKIVEQFGFKMNGKETGVYFMRGEFEIWSISPESI